MKRFATSLALAGMLAHGAASAAMAGPLTSNWSGCHLGGNIGWAGDDSQVVTRPSSTFNPVTTPAERALATRTYNFSDSSFTGGGQAGCDWQPSGSGWVLGLETDINAADLGKDVHRAYPANAPWLASTDTIGFNLDWYGTLRGRVGFAWDNLLLYATGGLAYGQVGSSFVSVVPASSTRFQADESKTKAGWTVGGGGEWAISDAWTIRAEYLHIDLGTFGFNSPNVLAPNPLSAQWRSDVDAKFDVVRLGVNYYFDDLMPMP